MLGALGTLLFSHGRFSIESMENAFIPEAIGRNGEGQTSLAVQSLRVVAVTASSVGLFFLSCPQPKTVKVGPRSLVAVYSRPPP